MDKEVDWRELSRRERVMKNALVRNLAISLREAALLDREVVFLALDNQDRRRKNVGPYVMNLLREADGWPYRVYGKRHRAVGPSELERMRAKHPDLYVIAVTSAPFSDGGFAIEHYNKQIADTYVITNMHVAPGLIDAMIIYKMDAGEPISIIPEYLTYHIRKSVPFLENTKYIRNMSLAQIERRNEARYQEWMSYQIDVLREELGME